MTMYKFVDENAEALARKDCRFCHGKGVEADYEGYPTPMPVYWHTCRCIWERVAYVEYFERPKVEQIYSSDIPF